MTESQTARNAWGAALGTNNTSPRGLEIAGVGAAAVAFARTGKKSIAEMDDDELAALKREAVAAGLFINPAGAREEYEAAWSAYYADVRISSAKLFERRVSFAGWDDAAQKWVWCDHYGIPEPAEGVLGWLESIRREMWAGFQYDSPEWVVAAIADRQQFGGHEHFAISARYNEAHLGVSRIPEEPEWKQDDCLFCWRREPDIHSATSAARMMRLGY